MRPGNIVKGAALGVLAMALGGGMTGAQAQTLQMQNLVSPGFICPGQPMTVTFQAQVDASNANPYVAGVLSTVGASSFDSTQDYLFIYSGGNNGSPIAPGGTFWNSKLANQFAVVPAGNLSMVTYTWVTTVPAGYTTGQVVHINIAGNEQSLFGYNYNMGGSYSTLTAAVTVDCTQRLMTNYGQFGGAVASAQLVIQQCTTNTPTSTPTKTPTATITATATLTPTRTATWTPTSSPTLTATRTPTASPTNTGPPAPTNTFTSTGTSTFTSTWTATPTSTFTFTVTNSPTYTFTATVSATSTSTATATPTRTASSTATNSATGTPSGTPTRTTTATWTRTPTFTPTLTNTPTVTPTPTATVPDLDIFYVSKNAFDPSNGPVSINVQYSKFPGDYHFWIYNSAGEHIRTLDSQNLAQPISASYTWDGTNKYGDKCASGVYVLYLVEPFSRKLKRVLLVR